MKHTKNFGAPGDYGVLGVGVWSGDAEQEQGMSQSAGIHSESPRSEHQPELLQYEAAASSITSEWMALASHLGVGAFVGTVEELERAIANSHRGGDPAAHGILAIALHRGQSAPIPCGWQALDVARCSRDVTSTGIGPRSSCDVSKPEPKLSKTEPKLSVGNLALFEETGFRLASQKGTEHSPVVYALPAANSGFLKSVLAYHAVGEDAWDAKMRYDSGQISKYQIGSIVEISEEPTDATDGGATGRRKAHGTGNHDSSAGNGPGQPESEKGAREDESNSGAVSRKPSRPPWRSKQYPDGYPCPYHKEKCARHCEHCDCAGKTYQQVYQVVYHCVMDAPHRDEKIYWQEEYKPRNRRFCAKRNGVIANFKLRIGHTFVRATPQGNSRALCRICMASYEGAGLDMSVCLEGTCTRSQMNDDDRFNKICATFFYDGKFIQFQRDHAAAAFAPIEQLHEGEAWHRAEALDAEENEFDLEPLDLFNQNAEQQAQADVGSPANGEVAHLIEAARRAVDQPPAREAIADLPQDGETSRSQSLAPEDTIDPYLLHEGLQVVRTDHSARDQEIRGLRAENSRLGAENSRLGAENSRLGAENSRLQAANSRMQGQNQRQSHSDEILSAIEQLRQELQNIRDQPQQDAHAALLHVVEMLITRQNTQPQPPTANAAPPRNVGKSPMQPRRRKDSAQPSQVASPPISANSSVILQNQIHSPAVLGRRGIPGFCPQHITGESQSPYDETSNVFAEPHAETSRTGRRQKRKASFEGSRENHPGE